MIDTTERCPTSRTKLKYQNNKEDPVTAFTLSQNGDPVSLCGHMKQSQERKTVESKTCNKCQSTAIQMSKKEKKKMQKMCVTLSLFRLWSHNAMMNICLKFIFIGFHFLHKILIPNFFFILFFYSEILEKNHWSINWIFKIPVFLHQKSDKVNFRYSFSI